MHYYNEVHIILVNKTNYAYLSVRTSGAVPSQFFSTGITLVVIEVVISHKVLLINSM